jgi:lysophospholipase L1-like esterase
MILQSVEVLTAEEANVLACFGDSITHGGFWTGPLIDSLYDAGSGRVAAFEMGVNGNRLLYDSQAQTRGCAGTRRFRHDILSIEGLTHVIFALGTNDLGHPGVKEWAALDELPTVDGYAAAAEKIAGELRSLGVKIIGTTIAPRLWSAPLAEKREALRREINCWIMESGVFDGVLDYSSILIDGEAPRLRAEYDCGDGIHINAAGGLELASRIPLELFLARDQ